MHNPSPCRLADVRLHVVAVDTGGRPIAETTRWVFGDIPPGGRGYFAISLPAAPAADYRVHVVSFDRITSPVPQTP